jgi:hypothetical protein
VAPFREHGREAPGAHSPGGDDRGNSPEEKAVRQNSNKLHETRDQICLKGKPDAKDNATRIFDRNGDDQRSEG